MLSIPALQAALQLNAADGSGSTLPDNLVLLAAGIGLISGNIRWGQAWCCLLRCLESHCCQTLLRDVPAWVSTSSQPPALSPTACSALEQALSYERLHPLYMTVKSYACCDVLNFLGGLWLGLLIVGCFGLPLTITVFVWVGRMDKLEPHG